MAPTPFEWLSVKFGQYYAAARPAIPHVERREFGFGGWEKKIEFRHISVRNESDLWARLRQDRPLYVSASAAYYEFPDARPMARKNWQGADLIFDLDADAHSCAPFTCPDCMDTIRGKTVKLIEDFLLPDFGLTRQELHVNFSGSRGYHVRVYKKEIEPLGREERREIVDYIEGAGLDYNQFLREETVPGTHFKRLAGPTPEMGGYGGKFAREIIRLSRDPASSGRISSKLKKKEEADRFVAGIESGNWSALSIPKAEEKFKDIFGSLRIKVSDQLDANVTADTSKILRLPDSIHGGSGLIAKTIPASVSAAEYQPYRDALAFSMSKKESVKLLRDVPSIEFGGQTHEALAKDATVELPEAYAVFLVCKKAAVPA
ncbi:MAG: DNA primase catalytic subunit PriS [Candidatus Micrarchaeota archaeon]|nr:DNA primase catalytic subunit PriS [Candidatus Micrarchaeota archaeon]